MPSGTRPDREVKAARDRERDRQARGGSGNSGARGTLSQQQDRRNAAAAAAVGNRAPGVKGPQPSQYDSRTLNPRYSQNLIASGPLTPHNITEAMRALPLSGFGAMSLFGGALGVPNLGPQYEGVTPRSATGFSYDSANRLGTMDGAMGRPSMNVRPVQAAGSAPPPAPVQQGMVPASSLGGPVQGLGNYGMNLPSYGYFGQPGQTRPGQSAILNPPYR